MDLSNDIEPGEEMKVKSVIIPQNEHAGLRFHTEWKVDVFLLNYIYRHMWSDKLNLDSSERIYLL